MYWTLFVVLIVLGILKIIFVKLKFDKGNKAVTVVSLGVSVLEVIFFGYGKGGVCRNGGVFDGYNKGLAGFKVYMS